MLTKGKRLLNAVKKIYKTITGKDSKSNDVTTVVEGIADNYTGEGGSGLDSLHTLIIGQKGSGNDDYKYETKLTVKVKDPNIASWNDLLSYLRNNGFESAYDDDPNSVTGYNIKMEICNGYSEDTNGSNQVIIGITAFDDGGEYGISLISMTTQSGDEGTYVVYNFDGNWLYAKDPITLEYLD